MIGGQSAYLVAEFDYPASSQVDFVFDVSDPKPGSVMLLFELGSGVSWVGEFRGWATDLPGVTGVWATSDPDVACVVVSGTVHLVDVTDPRARTTGNRNEIVLEIVPASQAELLLLLTPWDILAVRGRTVVWEARDVSVDGIEITDVTDNAVLGVARGAGEDAEFRISLDHGDVIWP